MRSARDELRERIEELIRDQRLLEGFLQRAARNMSDPEAIYSLWSESAEVRQMNRTLRRHRKEVDPEAGRLAKTRWPRRWDPAPEEALGRAIELSDSLAGRCGRGLTFLRDVWLKKYLELIAAEHEERTVRLRQIAEECPRLRPALERLGSGSWN